MRRRAGAGSRGVAGLAGSGKGGAGRERVGGSWRGGRGRSVGGRGRLVWSLIGLATGPALSSEVGTTGSVAVSVSVLVVGRG